VVQERSLLVGESVGHFVETLIALVSRELRMRYKGSFFGIVWALLSPLGYVVILRFLFTRILVIPIPHFSVFMYTAMLPWTWFQTSLQAGSTTLTENGDLVRTPFFAKPLLPCVVTSANFLLYLLALPVLFGLMVWEGVPLTGALVALPVIWITQGILTLGFTVLIAAFGILIRDVQHLIGVLLLFWFYLTPIFYGLEQLPPNIAGRFYLNPMTAIVSAHRDVTLYGRFPSFVQLGYVMLVSAGIVAVSLMIFRTLEDAFIEQL
jgi:lipopolysaccharide transport system permease protein